VDKKDVAYLVGALALVLVIALVIKPVFTGQPLDTGIPVPSTTLLVTTMPEHMPPLGTPADATPFTVIRTTTPTSSPTWNPAVVQTIVFVDPSQYGLSANETGLKGTRIDATYLNTSITTFATFDSSQGASGTSSIIFVPFPYWELEYTVEPAPPLSSVGKFEITPTQGSGIAHSGVEGSYSTVKPEFTIQVMDGDDPNRIVRTVTPPGGIDLNLWLGNKPEGGEYPTRTSSKYATQVTPEVTPVDPRPWTEKFYEGERNYYFIVTSKGLSSYSMKINVPSRYLA
jgi:hypothetical protein